MTTTAPSPQTLWRHALAITLVCWMVCWLGLSWRSFASSEGHRVAPAWEMLDRADAGEPDAFWRVRLFEHAYLRKPPGMPWAIAAMSSVFGRTEFAARSVSALSTTVGALAVWWFASRWFSARFAIASALAWVLMPQLWQPTRSAEIEALNNLGTMLACLAIADLAIGPARSRQRWLDLAAIIIIGAAGVCIAALAKGPASAPIIGGLLLAAAVMRLWSRRAVAGLLGIAGISAAVLIPIARKILAPAEPGPVITQGADEFLWAKGIIPVLMLAPAALVSALPASLALLFPWASAARKAAAAGGDGSRRSLRAARLLAVGWLVSLAIMCALGVSNPRYAMPGACLLAAMAGYVARIAWGPVQGPAGQAQAQKRRVLARQVMLGRPWALPLLLVGASVALTLATSSIRIGTDGRQAGRTLAQQIAVASADDPAAIVWADGLIEARPDVLLYARAHGPHTGTVIRPLWKKIELQRGDLPPAPTMLVLRTDSDSDERERYAAAITDGRLVSAGDGEVGRYRFTLFRRTNTQAETLAE